MFRSLALRGAASIAARRAVTTLGIRYPGQETAGLEGAYDYTLYDGAAGVGLVLAHLAVATGDAEWAVLANELGDGLGESTPSEGSLPSGLYTGFGGVALFHLAQASFFQDRKALERATSLASRLGARQPESAELLGGAAGAGLLQLAVHRATGDDVFLEGARRAFAFLADTALHDRRVVAWEPGIQDKSLQPGLAHGVAGPCLFLAELAAQTGDRGACRLRDAAFRWLDACAVPTFGDGLTWPKDVTTRARQHHWCHGSVGVGQAYLALHRGTGDARSLHVAEAAARAAWHHHRRRSAGLTCHCHGTAGAIELFLDLHDAGVRGRWRERAEALARGRFGSGGGTPGGRRDGLALTLGGEGAGLMLGTAGIVRQLMRLAGLGVAPVVPWTMGRVRVSRAPRPRPRRAVPLRPEPPTPADVRHLLPPVAAQIRDTARFRGRSVILGPLDDAGTRRVLSALRRTESGDAWHASLASIESACGRLQRRHPRLLAPGAVGPRTFGVLLREIAGLALRAGSDPAHVRTIARHMTRQTVSALELMLQRLEVDACSALAADVGGRVVEVAIQGGDPHRGGQRVVSLRFEEGIPILYKPRSLAVDRELAGAASPGERPTLADLARGWVTPAVEGAALPSHRIVAAGPTHGYAERIVTEELPVVADVDVDLAGAGAWDPPIPRVPCLEAGEDARYWYAAGLLAGYAFGLGVQDLHVENVLCGRTSSTPHTALHAVDLELGFGLVDDLRETALTDVRRGEAPPEANRRSYAGLAPCLDLTCGVGAEEWTFALTEHGVETTPRRLRAVVWAFAHLVRNSAGTFGYRTELCTFLRGMADQWWALRCRAREVSAHLRRSLAGAPVRILAKSTQSYNVSLHRRKLGGMVADGAPYGPEWPSALRLTHAELRQLDALDYPYFFRYLPGGRHAAGRTWYFDVAGGRSRRAPELDPLHRVHEPFWTISRRQHEGRFAAALLDAVAMVVGPGSFDAYDRSLGVRAQRVEGGPLTVGIHLGPRRGRRLVARALTDGSARYRLD